MEEGAREVFYKGTNSIHKGTTLRPNYVPKVPPPNNITLGIRILTREFDGGLLGGRRTHMDDDTHEHSDHSSASYITLPCSISFIVFTVL